MTNLIKGFITKANFGPVWQMTAFWWTLIIVFVALGINTSYELAGHFGITGITQYLAAFIIVVLLLVAATHKIVWGNKSI